MNAASETLLCSAAGAYFEHQYTVAEKDMFQIWKNKKKCQGHQQQVSITHFENQDSTPATKEIKQPCKLPCKQE